MLKRVFTMWVHIARNLRFSLVMALSVITPLEGQAETVLPADQPEESVTYWKAFEISPSEDPLVKSAHEIFNRLLLGWEETRIAPKLYVVHSERGPWAASLDDGAILLSRKAIDVSWKGGVEGGRDRLAFVLAHELAHQRADHLWHRRFFRLAGKQPPHVKGRLLGGIGGDQVESAELEAKEAQADHEGLLLMAMVGFDPYMVVGGQSRFFHDWIESIWGDFCKEQSDTEDCAKVERRVERVRVLWQETARQAVLFELGVQAYVSEQYGLARSFFTAFGRQFPRREVHNNIGLTYVGEALGLRKRLLAKGEDLGPQFVYPYLLEDKPSIQREQPRGGGGTRGGSDTESARWRKEMEHHLKEAALSFEKALKIDPVHRPSYWNLASTHLMVGNAPRAYGLLAGNYIKRFGQNAMASMLLGIVAYLEGQPEKARSLLKRAVAQANEEMMPFARMNLAAYLRATGDTQGERAEWKALATWGRRQGDEGLFQFALHQLGKQANSTPPVAKGTTEKVHGYGLGQRVPAGPAEASHSVRDELWVEGERIQVYRFDDGGRMAVDANHTILALWQAHGKASTAARIQIGDDAAKVGRKYGVPTRKVRTIQGEYLAYDDFHISFRIVMNKVKGWFLYVPRG